MAINAYSYAKDGTKFLSKNFRVREFRCKDDTDPIFIDSDLVGVAPSKVAEYVETLMPNTGGIGRYSTFTHVDVRATKSRWNG